jgi:hypothetical protein
VPSLIPVSTVGSPSVITLEVAIIVAMKPAIVLISETFR